MKKITNSKKDTKLSNFILLVKLWKHISNRRKKQLFFLAILIIITSFAEVISISAILPFIAVLTDIKEILKNNFLQNLFINILNFDFAQIKIFITIFFIFITVIGASIRLLNIWVNGRISSLIGSDLSYKIFKNILYQTYEEHKLQNSSKVIVSTTNHIGLTVYFISQALQFVASLIIVLSIVLTLIYIDFKVAVTLFISFGISYFLLALTTRKKLERNGSFVALASEKQVKVLQESLGSIRNVLLEGAQPLYLKLYKNIDIPMRRYIADNQFYGVFPRFSLEALGIIIISLTALPLALRNSDTNLLIAKLGTIAVGAQRLLPSMQMTYGAWATMKAYKSNVVKSLEILNKQSNLKEISKKSKILKFKEKIKISNIYFSYPNQIKSTIKNVSLDIKKGESVGIIGTTGSGKSTFLDILMGLLEPSKGSIFIDGLDIHDPYFPERISAWRSLISHVPQDNYLLDATITENIAFAVPKEQINFKKVYTAAKNAQILQFIESQENGFDTVVGERGVKLSGGERQRIAIARALYKNSEILILDESTSSLDKVTERSFIKTLEFLKGKLTVIAVAHKVSTLREFDRIVRISKGVIEKQGTPKEMLDL